MANVTFGGNEVALDIALSSTSEYRFKNGGILITLNAEMPDTAYPQSHLLEYKQGMDELSKKSKTYVSVLQMAAGNQIVITEHYSKNIGYFRFRCINGSRTKCVRCSLQFLRPDSKKASELLNGIIKGIVFAN